MTSDIDKLRARHRLRFIEDAQKRIDRGLQLILTQSAENAAKVSDELRSLAGEASILGLDTTASVARAGADAARLWEEQGSQSAVRVCEHALHTLSDTIEILSEMNTGEFTIQADAVVSRVSDSRRGRAVPVK